MHLLVRNGEPRKTVDWVREGIGIPAIGAHHTIELRLWDAGTKVDGIIVEIARIDLGGVDLDNGPVLGITLVADTDVDERRENDIAQNATTRGGLVSRNVMVEVVEPFHRLPRLIQLGLDLLAITICYRVVPPTCLSRMPDL